MNSDSTASSESPTPTPSTSEGSQSKSAAPRRTAAKSTSSRNPRVSSAESSKAPAGSAPADDSPTGRTPASKSPARKQPTAKSSTTRNSTAKSGTSRTRSRAATTPQAASSSTETSNTTRRAIVFGANRTPFGKIGGKYADATNLDMLTAALGGLVARYQLQGEKLGELIGGAVLKHSKDFNLSREAILGSALDPRTPGLDIQRACATSIEAVGLVAAKIKLGQYSAGIAGGADSSSDAPIVVTDRLRKTLMRLNRAKTFSQRAKLIGSLRPRDLSPVAPNVNEPRTGLSMGEHQALTTLKWGITREAQDEIAFNSHQNLAAAYERGFFDDLITPYRGLTRDEALRPDTSLEKLAKLRPVFGNRGASAEGASMTAGNSTPLSDGAAVVLLGTEEWGAERGLVPLAHIVDTHTAAVDFVRGKEGLLMAGAYAVPELLDRQGLTLGDFDFVEIHEAFASTVLTTLAAWKETIGEVDPARLNVIGSSLAAGHPFGATGARIVGSAAKLVAEKARETGMTSRAIISVCAAGGQATAAIVESV